MPDASATTVNITSNVPLEVQTEVRSTKLKHSHKPNFGRFVEGCEACKLMPPKTKKAKDDKDAEIERLKLELAKAYTVSSAAPLPSDDDVNRQLANLMLRREAKELRKEEESEERKELARQDFLKVEKENVAQKRAREAACEASGHRKENGRSAICADAIHANGMVKPFCQRCWKTWPWRYPTQEQNPTAVSA